MVDMSDSMTSGQRVLQQLLSQKGAVQQVFQQPQAVPTQVSVNDITPEVKLELFSDVLDEIAAETTQPSVLSQALPIAVQTYLEPQIQASSSKEQLVVLLQTQELPGGMQYAEVEHTPEIPPEVESYIERVTDQSDQKQEVVVRAEEPPAPTSIHAPIQERVVKVLPLTKVQEEIGMKKNATFSVRWLVEFSHKIAKMFFGNVIYKQAK